MWIECDKYNKNLPDVNEELLKIEGELNDKEAYISFVDFLRANLSVATSLLSGLELEAYQEIVLKAMFNRHFTMCVLSRGGSKSFLAAVFCFLYCIFNPGARILIAGPTFRTARNIFTELEKIINSPGGKLLAQCFAKTDMSKRNDLFEWKINGGSIRAIPLNGEKIRGFRCDVLLIDEFLLLSKEIVEEVLMPFLIAPMDMGKRIKTVKKEKRAVKEGKLKQDDMTKFESTAKMIVLSSASYTFENLYSEYKQWQEKILSHETEIKASYAILQLGYEALPPHMVDKSIIEKAQNGGASHSSFLREYGAQFVDDSEGYFSAKKMKLCTIPDTEDPHLQLTGKKANRYLIAIDPSFSNANNSDYFAIAVLMLDAEGEGSTLVHNYAIAGGDLKDHILYFTYLYKTFAPEMIIIDNAGFQFIDACNESEWFRTNEVSLHFIEEWDSDKTDTDYQKVLQECRNKYNKSKGRICVKQFFSTDFIRRSNEHLQACIDHQRVWFASKITPDDSYFTYCTNLKNMIPLEDLGLDGKERDEKILELISIQDKLIDDVKAQCALIEVKSTAKGSQTFDLPRHLAKSTAVDRARKDNYTALLLGTWLVKCYHEIMSVKEERTEAGFAPISIQQV